MRCEMSNNNVVLQSQEEALTAVSKLLETIKQRAANTDINSCVPRETIDELLNAGLFSVVKSKKFGGSDLGFSTLVKVGIEIASACGSTGWVYGVLAGHSWLLNLFPEKAQQEIFADPRALTATIFRMNGTITEDDGGYRLNGGTGCFCSGVDFADWVIIGNQITYADGRPPKPHFFIIPRSDAEIIDDWNTVGMRGTGSKTIKVAENTFIPAHRAVSLDDMLNGTSPGADFHKEAIYRLPFSEVVPFSITAAPLGMAKGAMQVYTKMTKARLKEATEEELLQNTYAITELAIAQTGLEAGIGLVVGDAERIDNLAKGTDMSPADRVRIPRNWAYAVDQARQSTNQVFKGNLY